LKYIFVVLKAIGSIMVLDAFINKVGENYRKCLLKI